VPFKQLGKGRIEKMQNAIQRRNGEAGVGIRDIMKQKCGLQKNAVCSKSMPGRMRVAQSGVELKPLANGQVTDFTFYSLFYWNWDSVR